MLGTAVATAVCATNIAVLVYTRLKFKVDDEGVATVFAGSCGTSKTITLWSDLAVNLLSTILLAASNNAAQLLSAPSRREINAAHDKGKWLEIGVPSIRNLLHVPRWRVLLWAFLVVSSIPLHLLLVSANNTLCFGLIS